MLKLGAPLTQLDVSGNALSGTLGAGALGSMAELRTLSVYMNSLSGTLPAALGESRALVNLEADSLRLSGTLPSTLGSLPRLYAIVLGGGNKISGTLPAALEKLEKLEVLSIDGNALRGVPPPLPWAQYDADCQLGGNAFTCPSGRALAHWRVAEKQCAASCHAPPPVEGRVA